MEKTDVVFWLCAALNVGTAIALAWRLRHRVHVGLLGEHRAKRVYSVACLVAGAVAGMVLFPVTVSLLALPVGHGEILLAAPIFNLLLAGVLIAAGRIAIAWTPLRW